MNIQEEIAKQWALVEEVREKRKTTPKHELKCVNCNKHPTVFQNEKVKKEFEELSQLCGACWEVVTLETDAYPDDIERAKEICLEQDREYQHSPRGWKCLKCGTQLTHQFRKDICKCPE